MRFNPEDANAALIPSDTWLEAVIISAEEKRSRAGNEMIEAGFKVYDEAGVQPTITHYFVSNKPAMFKKLCSALKLNFDSGEIAASELKGKSLWVKVKIQKSDDPQYSDKNVIAAFSATAPGGVIANAPRDDFSDIF